MLQGPHKTVQLPLQAIADNELLEPERLTLAFLYAYADEHGLVDATPQDLEGPRGIGRNSVRRHIYRLEELRYVVILHKANMIKDPKRKLAEGYALTLRPSGYRYPIATGNRRIGSKGWDKAIRPAS